MGKASWYVSAHHLEWIPALCDKHNIRVEKLLSELSSDDDISFDTTLSWPVFAEIVSTAGRFFNTSSIRQAGALSLSQSPLAGLDEHSRRLLNLSDQYLLSWGPNGRVLSEFPVTAELVSQSEGYLTIKVSLLDQSQACQPLFHFIAGQMEALANISFGISALIDITEIESGATFDIRFTDNFKPDRSDQAAPLDSKQAQDITDLYLALTDRQTQQHQDLLATQRDLNAAALRSDQNSQAFESLGHQISGASWLSITHPFRPKYSGGSNLTEQKIQKVSDATLGILGYTEVEFIKLEPKALIKNHDAVIHQLFDLAKETGDASKRVTLLSKSGEELSARLSIHVFDTRHGDRLTWWLAAPLENNIPKDTLLANEENAFRKIADASPDAIITFNSDHQITYANTVCTKLFGYTHRELIHSSIKSLIPEALGGTALREIYQLKPTGSATKLTLTGLHQDRHLLPIEVSVIDHTNHGESLTSCIIRSLDQQRENEAETKALKDQLKMAQKLTALGQLSGGITHDFNNLLVAIIGYTDMALEQHPSQSLTEYLQEIRSAGRRGQDLTQQILAFSRQTIHEKKLIAADTLISNVSKLIRRLLPANVHLQTSPPCHLSVMADQSQLEQVLINIAINAGHAMPDGGTLTIGLSHSDSNTLLLAISDTGSGMDEATQNRIFEPFFTTKPEGRGTGLGLSVAFDIIDQHEGTINVTSNIGHGTRFDIVLPVASTRESGNIARSPTIRETPRHREAICNETVLVVEDNPQALELTRLILSGAGYHVIEATSAEQALGWFQSKRELIDLALIDVVLPSINGHTLSEQIRNLVPGLPVIFTTGYPLDSPALDSAKESDDLLLPKPFGTQQLRRTIRDTLDRQQALRANSVSNS